jgi:hypothetical protein
MRLALLALLAFAPLAGCLANGPASGTQAPDAAEAAASAAHVVIAHIDTGINPYHAAFRWDSPLAYRHPSTYIPGYPADARALNLTLTAKDYASAVKADEKVWAGVRPGHLYWIPGTKIVGAISLGPGGTLCPTVPVPPANQVDPTGTCQEHPILDDFGHGTMTSSRMAGTNHSLDPDGLIVSIEGTGQDAVDWVVKAGFIDVVSNSWGSLTPTPTPDDQQLARHIREAARHALFLFASGNGVGFLNGIAGQPTQASPTFPPGVVIVGAHDNGYATTWHGAPPHVIADGYGGWRANPYDLHEWSPSPDSCCTSASAPYAAGGAAAIVLEARRILGDTHTGVRGSGDEGVLASGAKGLVASGPLADGNLTLGELKRVLESTAQPRPAVSDAQSDDGLVNWAATGSMPKDPWPGDNPYCVGCFSSPVRLSSIPADTSLVTSIGYGAINHDSVAVAKRVLHGEVPLPVRSMEDQFFAQDEAARTLLYPS